jgi:hypothetical protein
MARHRKTRRVHRKGTRKATRRMHQRGGFIQLNPADVNDSSMAISSKINILQGQEYGSVHAGQHGGQNMIPAGYHKMPNGTVMANTQMGGMADVGYTGMLDSSLRGAARMDPLDQSYNEIIGMKDQGGGRRRRARKGRKASRKSRKGRRNMKGGFSPIDAPTMLLQGDQAKEAVMGFNPEWKLAENPAAFDPSK